MLQDLSAQIDYALKVSGREQVYYAGKSFICWEWRGSPEVNKRHDSKHVKLAQLHRGRYQAAQSAKPYAAVRYPYLRTY